MLGINYFPTWLVRISCDSSTRATVGDVDPFPNDSVGQFRTAESEGKTVFLCLARKKLSQGSPGGLSYHRYGICHQETHPGDGIFLPAFQTLPLTSAIVKSRSVFVTHKMCLVMILIILGIQAA